MWPLTGKCSLWLSVCTTKNCLLAIRVLSIHDQSSAIQMDWIIRSEKFPAIQTAAVIHLKKSSSIQTAELIHSEKVFIHLNSQAILLKIWSFVQIAQVIGSKKIVIRSKENAAVQTADELIHLKEG